MNTIKQLDLDFEVYSQLFLSKIPLARMVNKNTVSGRCIVCNDSKTNKRKTRLYLMRDRGKYPNVVVCHNCFLSTSAKTFFESHFPEEMKELEKGLSERDISKIKILKDDEPKCESKRKLREEDEYLLSLETEVEKAKDKLGSFFNKYTVGINSSPEALNYMKNRSVPNIYIKQFRLLHPDYHNQKLFRYAYLKDYIIIPFVDLVDARAYYFHSRRYRKFENSMAKYLACPYSPDDVQIDFYFNELNVTSDYPIIICEGTISSMNLPNSIATNGIGKQTEEFIKKIEWKYGGSSGIIYANDNELVDHDAMEKAKELLNKGKNVFLWSLMVKDFPFLRTIKDFNDLCVVSKKTMIPLSTIEKYTRNDLISLVKAISNGC
jgi:hypothetical protein